MDVVADAALERERLGGRLALEPHRAVRRVAEALGRRRASSTSGSRTSRGGLAAKLARAASRDGNSGRRRRAPSTMGLLPTSSPRPGGNTIGS